MLTEKSQNKTRETVLCLVKKNLFQRIQQPVYGSKHPKSSLLISYLVSLEAMICTSKGKKNLSDLFKAWDLVFMIFFHILWPLNDLIDLIDNFKYADTEKTDNSKSFMFIYNDFIALWDKVSFYNSACFLLTHILAFSDGSFYNHQS